MNIQIHSTDQMKTFNGVECRVWEGISQGGIEVFCLIPRIAHKDMVTTEQADQFRNELREMAPPSDDAIKCFSLRQII